MSLSQNLPVYPPWHAQPMYTNLLSVLILSPSSGCPHWPPCWQAHMLIVGLQVALAPLSSVATNDKLNCNKFRGNWHVRVHGEDRRQCSCFLKTRGLLMAGRTWFFVLVFESLFFIFFLANVKHKFYLNLWKFMPWRSFIRKTTVISFPEEQKTFYS